jgi:PAS domain S-box-containing protein
MRSTLLRYGAAAGVTATAAAARLLIDQVSTIDLPFLVFFPAVLASALWFGLGPALFSTLFSCAIVAWLWLPPEGLAVTGASAIQGLVLFGLSGALMAGLVESSRRGHARDRAIDAARREADQHQLWQAAAEQQLAALSQAVDARTEELNERDALMRAIVETAVDAILTIDERGVVRSFNPAAERMFGYAAAEVVGHNVDRLMPAPHRERHDAYLAQYRSSGVRKIIGIGREIAALRKDGSIFPMYLSVSEVVLSGERRFTGFIRDLTEQKQLEQEFLRSQKLEAIGSLAGAIAHDFNNILMGILACSRLASQEAAQAGARESFDEIAAAANRGVALTRRLLALSRRAPAAEPQPTNLDRVLQDNETMLRHLLGEDVVLTIDAASGASLLGDGGELEQIVINLLVNARDAMPGGGPILVSTRSVGHEVVLEVKDSGCGIPPEDRARIFEPFFTTKGPDKGTGLGLSTVKRITERLKGRIELESELGQGSTFRLSFPRCAAAPDPPTAAQRPSVARRGQRSVLLVEDDRLVRASLLRFLKGRGYTVLAAASPSEALAIARKEPSIDVLVTDMVLPEITGSELALRLRTQAPRMQVIYMSAHPQEVLTSGGNLEAGAPYLEKPFEMEELEQLLDRVLAISDDPRDVHAARA